MASYLNDSEVFLICPSYPDYRPRCRGRFFVFFCDNSLRSNNLKVHQQTYPGEKPFGCSRCDKTFSHSSYLQKHKQIHREQMLFPCSRCNKVCSQSGSLKRHQKSHTGEKTGSCTLCKKAFSLSHQLKLHQRTHSGEKHIYVKNVKILSLTLAPRQNFA